MWMDSAIAWIFINLYVFRGCLLIYRLRDPFPLGKHLLRLVVENLLLINVAFVVLYDHGMAFVV